MNDPKKIGLYIDAKFPLKQYGMAWATTSISGADPVITTWDEAILGPKPDDATLSQWEIDFDGEN